LNIEHRREEKEEEKRKRIYREGAKVAKGHGVRRVKSYLLLVIGEEVVEHRTLE
jgi:hypothetical protein